MTREQIEKKASKFASFLVAEDQGQQPLIDLLTTAMCWLLSHQWVSVEDEMPKISEIVLIRNKDGKIARATYGIVGRFDNGNTIEYVNGWILNDVGVRMGNSDVTHWMPIPPLAEEGGEK